jgi:hypothetical protein
MILKRYNIIFGKSNSNVDEFALALSKFTFLETYHFTDYSCQVLNDIKRSSVILYGNYNLCVNRDLRYLPHHHVYFIINDSTAFEDHGWILDDSNKEKIVKYLNIDYCETNIMHIRGINYNKSIIIDNCVYTLESLESEFRDFRIDRILE